MNITSDFYANSDRLGILYYFRGYYLHLTLGTIENLIRHSIKPLIFVSLLYLFSCKAYRQNILFNTEEEIIPEQVIREVAEAEKNYIIQKNDYLRIDVYTNNGEVIIDPNNELLTTDQRFQINKPEHEFLVRDDGYVTLPMVGDVKLERLTLDEANKELQSAYNKFYNDPFVITSYSNKRVVVLGAPGGMVIPLQNENMKLLEVIALAGGISNEAKGNNIRLIRGPLTNPTIYMIDLTTIEGIRKAEMNIEPGDVIYIEPVRRVITESVRDVAPIFSIASSILTLIVVIQNL